MRGGPTRSIDRRVRQWAGNPSPGQAAIAAVIAIVCFLLVMLLLYLGGFLADGVSYPLAVVLIVGLIAFQTLVMRLLARGNC